MVLHFPGSRSKPARPHPHHTILSARYFGELISAEEVAKREENTYHYKLDSEVIPQPSSMGWEGNLLPQVGRQLPSACLGAMLGSHR